MTTQRSNHLSASSIAAFKACPQRYRLAYVEGIRKDEDTEAQRMGTNWHAIHELYYKALQPAEGDTEATDRPAAALTAVADHLNERYGTMPTGYDATKWAIERAVLLTSFIGYLWRWSEDPFEVLVSELPFNLPLYLPRSGMPLPMSEVQRVGKIDHVIKWQGAICSLERKSTSRAIDADSDYWDKAKKDTQVSMYALAFRDLRDKKELLFNAERYGNTMYDVWHKPTIKPCELTQKATAEFLASGEYCGATFNVNHYKGVGDLPDGVMIDGAAVPIIQGKKGFAIRETIDMYSARLLQDIYERPDFYFQRREIVRTDAELAFFKKQLYAVYSAQKSFAANNSWFENEQQCRATFSCAYLGICYGAGADAVCDGKTTPPGYKRIFVDLTVRGAILEDGD